jgi:tripartite-type tricarboxylate transporter receptor subunit TctC
MGIAAYIGTWRGIFAKKGTPQGAIDAMEAALEKAWNMKPYQDFCKAEGYSERKGFEGQADFEKLIDADYKAFEEFLKAAGFIK